MEFDILGPLQVVDRGRRLDLGGHRQRAVLAILVLHADEVVSLDQLIDLLWGSTPPNAATGSLQAYVSNLRRVLEPSRGPRQTASVLVTEAPGYRLRVEPDAIDAVRSERLAADGRRLLLAGATGEAIARFDTALALWRGEALGEFRFEVFAAADVARLDELRAATEEDRIEAWLAAGDNTGALPELERLIAHHPLRERLRRLQMLALYRSGRQAEALRAYDDIRRVLEDELGLDPGPQLQTLFRQVLEQDPALDASGAPRSIELAPVTAVAASAVPGRSEAPTSSSFVGRAAVLAVMDDAVDEALQGRSRVVLVGGEPGIGKTRLAEEVCRRAAARGAIIGWGRCHDDVGMPALWPWEQVLRATRADDSEPASIEDLAAPAGDPRDPVLPDEARFRFYDRFRDALERRASAAPLVLVLDDLQWADNASLRLLCYLAVELTTAPVLVLATFHEPAPANVGPLTAALADLARQDRVDRVTLGPLTVAEVTELVRSAVPNAGALQSLAGVARELHRRTDGNAFFVTELIRLLLSERALPTGLPADVPAGIGDVVRRRLARLPEDVQAVLTVACVIGREFELDVLDRVAGLGADAALEILEAAVMARAVVEIRPGDYRFAHGLVHETLYGDLQPGRKARLHLRVAEAIETATDAGVDERVSHLAHHFAAAGASAAAARYAELAALKAERSLAYDEAAAHWQAALDAMGPAADQDAHAARARLLLRLATALTGAGDAAGTAQAHVDALDAAEASGDASLLAEAAFAYGEIDLWQFRPYGSVDERVAAAISRALELQPDEGPLHGRLLVGLAIALYYREDARERGRELVRQAVAEARRIGDTELLMHALLELVVMLEASPARDEQLRIVDEVESLLRTDPPFSIAATAIMRGVRMRLAAGEGASVEERIDDLWRVAVQRRHVGIELWSTWARAGIAFVRGRLAEAERLADAAFALHQRVGIWGAPETYVLHMTFVWREQDRITEVAPMVEPLLRGAHYPGARKLLAFFALEQGAIDEIAALLGPQPMPPMHDFIWLLDMCTTAELCAAARLDCIDDVYRALLPFEGIVATMDGTFSCLGAVSHYLGLLADAGGRRGDAVRHLEAAIELNDRIGAVPWSVRSRLHVAPLLEDADRASVLLEEALCMAEQHDLVASSRRLRVLLQGSHG